jgi:Zn-dependent M28 family amino/carboxypeptidase
MRVVKSQNASVMTADPGFQDYLAAVLKEDLAKIVDEIAVPRHFRVNSRNNHRVAEFIYSELEAIGYETRFQGTYSNIIASNPNSKAGEPVILIGAHFDSVPDCPGADDNASAVAGLMVCARLLAEMAPRIPVCFAAFNCEEDGLVGSRDFVANYLLKSNLKISEAHILEMIGYATDEQNSQSMPPGLLLKLPSAGNFLGLLGNRQSNKLVDETLSISKTFLPDLPVLGLKLYLGVEKLVPDLGRSDHLPFWEQKIPALMWTDTANFRNPHYHRLTDTPETLNYSFLQKVTQLLLLNVLNHQKK